MVKVKSSAGITSLTLNAPQKYNALSKEMMESLLSAIRQASSEKTCKVIILKGEGKGFCAGHDLKELNGEHNQAYYEELFELCCTLMEKVQEIPQTVIAQVHGVATAAGCQLVASCDLAVATSNARFATPGVLIGLFCSTPMVALSRNVAPKHALEMLLTGEMISAQRAYEIGLVNRLAEPDELESAVTKLAQSIADKSPYVLGLGKSAFYKQLEMPSHKAYQFATETMVKNLLTQDAKEGISAFLEKRKPEWKVT